MAEETAEADGEAPRKKSKLPLLIGLVLMLVLGGGGFYATYSGMILGGDAKEAAAHGEDGAAGHGEGAAAGHGEDAGHGAAAEVDFVTIPPLLISLAPGAHSSHLRFAADLEVAPAQRELVTRMMPRVQDVLNGYLRAVRVEDIEDPSALTRLRAQMLRRIQTVLGENVVRGLLVTEFVLN